MHTHEKGHKRRAKHRFSRDWTKPVHTVLENYVDACRYEPIGAVRLGPYGDSRPRVNAYRMAEYKIDIQLGIADAFRYHAHLIPALQNLIKEMAEEPCEPVSAGDRVAVIQKLGPVFARRGLAPYKYFTRRK